MMSADQESSEASFHLVSTSGIGIANVHSDENDEEMDYSVNVTNLETKYEQTLDDPPSLSPNNEMESSGNEEADSSDWEEEEEEKESSKEDSTKSRSKKRSRSLLSSQQGRIWSNFKINRCPDNPSKLISAICNRCNKLVSPRLYRLKNHLSGGKCDPSKQTSSADKIPTQVAVGRPRSKIWEHYTQDGAESSKVICKLCNVSVSGKSERMLAHYQSKHVLTNDKFILNEDETEERAIVTKYFSLPPSKDDESQKNVEVEAKCTLCELSVKGTISSGNFLDHLANFHSDELALELFGNEDKELEKKEADDLFLEQEDVSNSNPFFFKNGSAGGRHKDPAWTFFFLEDNKGICKFCKAKVSPQAPRLRVHLTKAHNVNASMGGYEEVLKASSGLVKSLSLNPEVEESKDFHSLYLHDDNPLSSVYAQEHFSSQIPHHSEGLSQFLSIEMNEEFTFDEAGNSSVGRKRDSIWQQFKIVRKTEAEGIEGALCKICSMIVSPKAYRLREHFQKFHRKLYNSLFGMKNTSNYVEEQRLANLASRKSVKLPPLPLPQLEVPSDSFTKPESENEGGGDDLSDSDLKLSAGGRKKDNVWSYYVVSKSGKKLLGAACKFCKKSISPQAPRLKQHILNYHSTEIKNLLSSSKPVSENNGNSSDDEPPLFSPASQSDDSPDDFEEVIVKKEIDPEQVSSEFDTNQTIFDKGSTSTRTQNYHSSLSSRDSTPFHKSKGYPKTSPSTQINKRCSICQKAVKQINSYAFNNWRKSCAESIVGSFKLDKSFESTLTNFSYCNSCEQIIRDIDFTVTTLNRLKSNLNKFMSLYYNRVKIQMRAMEKDNISESRKTLGLDSHFKKLKSLYSAMSKSGMFNDETLTKESETKPKREFEYFNVASKKKVISKPKAKVIKTTHLSRQNRVSHVSRFGRQSLKPIQYDDTDYVESYHHSNDDFSNAGDDDMDIDDLSEKNSTNSAVIAKDKNATLKTVNYTTNKQFKLHPISRLDLLKQKILKKREITRMKVRKNGMRKFCNFGDCSFTCRKQFTLDIHFRLRHENDATPYHCPREGCFEKFEDHPTYLAHIKLHTEKRAICQICFRRYRNMTDHMERMHPNEPIVPKAKCRYCMKMIAVNELGPHEELHIAKHNESLPYACVFCDDGKTFTNTTDLRAHVEYAHAEPGYHKCDACKKAFKLHKSFLLHVQTYHPDPSASSITHSCEICGKGFVDGYRLKKHVQAHSNERPFLCSLCGKSFKTANNLKIHNMLHNGETPWKCQFCPKAFNMSCKLKAHEEIHSPSLNYTCALCGKSFRTQKNLAQHTTYYCPNGPKKPYHKSVRKEKTHNINANVVYGISGY